MIQQHQNQTKPQAQFAVTLVYRGRCFRSVETKEVSMREMRVAISGVFLPVGTKVEISFCRWGRDWLIPAVVTQINTDKMSLAFQIPQPMLHHYERFDKKTYTKFSLRLFADIASNTVLGTA